MKFPVIFSLLVLFSLSSCSVDYNGTYSYARGEDYIYYIILKGDVLHSWIENVDSGGKNEEIKYTYHLNDKNFIILDELIESEDPARAKTIAKRWNAVGVEIKDNTIYFYDDLDRNQELLKFTKE